MLPPLVVSVVAARVSGFASAAHAQRGMRQQVATSFKPSPVAEEGLAVGELLWGFPSHRVLRAWARSLAGVSGQPL